MAAKPKPTNEKSDEKDQNEVETEGASAPACVQLQRRREGEAPVTTELNGQTVDTPLVRLDLYASPPPAAASAASAAASTQGARWSSSESPKEFGRSWCRPRSGSRSLRTALAEQVEASASGG